MPTLDEFWALDHAHPDDFSWTFLEFSKRIAHLGPEPETGWKIIREELEPSVPVPFRIGYGKVRPDAYFNGSGRPLYSGRLVRAMEAAGCQGLRKFPVALYDRRDKTLLDDDLYIVYPARGAGPVDLLRGAPLMLSDLQRWRRDPELKGCYGLFFDPNSWTGLDLFRPSNHNTVLITRRIAEAIQAGNFLGVRLSPVPEFRRDFRDRRVAFIKMRHPHGPPPPEKPPPPGSPPV